MFRTTTTIAAVFGLTAFAISVIAGLASGVAGPTVLGRAILCMLGCYMLGLFAGRLGEFVAIDYLKSYKDASPIMEDVSALIAREGGAGAAPTSAGGKEVAEGSSVAMV